MGETTDIINTHQIKPYKSIEYSGQCQIFYISTYTYTYAHKYLHT